MAGRDFAMVRKSLLRSRKFRGLTHEARWAWLCACLRSEWSGVFEYQTTLWASDAELTEEKLTVAISQLVESKIIEWSSETETVRVVGFHKRNPPDNASAAKRLCDDFVDALLNPEDEQVPMLLSAACELAVAALIRAQKWDNDSPDWPKLRAHLGGLMTRLYGEFEEEVTWRLVEETNGVQKAVLNEAASLLPSLAMSLKDTVSTPCLHPIDTRRRRRDGDTDEDSNKDGDGSRFDVSANSSALSSVEPLEVLRKGKGFEGIATIHPLEETKRSALALGGSS